LPSGIVQQKDCENPHPLFDNRQLLELKPNAFFSANIVARKPENSDPESNPYLRKFLRQIAWRPGKLAVFAGKLDYPRYGAFDRVISEV
jgi:menaquinone-dependent protoporphyrinogen oxidase